MAGGSCECESGASTLQFSGTPTVLTTIGVTSTRDSTTFASISSSAADPSTPSAVSEAVDRFGKTSTASAANDQIGYSKVLVSPATSSTSSTSSINDRLNYSATLSSPASTSKATLASTSPPSAASTSALPQKSSSTSSAFKVGLGVGISLGFLVAMLAVYLVLRIRRQRVDHTPLSQQINDSEYQDKPIVEPQPPAYPSGMSELAGDGSFRLLATEKRSELPATTTTKS